MSEKLAIFGGEPVRKKAFYYESPIGEEEIQAAIRVLHSKKLSGFYQDFLGGEMVQTFENKFAGYLNCRYAASFNSGTSALHVALLAVGVTEGSEVIVPAVSFTATAAAVSMIGARPVFVDVDPETFCLDASQIEAKITDRTKAILPVHLYGKVAPMEAIMAIAEKYNLKVIEDACQAPGCQWNGQKVGTVGDAGVFSFVETKNMVIGEGGMVVCNNEEFIERIRLIRNHGEAYVQNESRAYLSDILGYNFRLTEVSAAIGIEQINKLDNLNRIRRENARFLEEALKGRRELRILHYGENEICHLFPMFYDETKTGISRDKFMEIANAEGVSLTKGYPHPMYKNKIYQENDFYKDVCCPVAEELCRQLICFRYIHYPYTVDDMKDCLYAFEKIFNNMEAVL